MPEIAKASGNETFPVTDGETTWRMSSVETLDAAGKFEQWMAESYMAQVHRLGRGSPPDVYARSLAEAAARLEELTFGSPQMMQRLGTTSYLTKLLLLSLQPQHPKATEADAKGLIARCEKQIIAALAHLNPNTFKVQAAAGSDPKAPAADAATAPPPTTA